MACSLKARSGVEAKLLRRIAAGIGLKPLQQKHAWKGIANETWRTWVYRSTGEHLAGLEAQHSTLKSHVVGEGSIEDRSASPAGCPAWTTDGNVLLPWENITTSSSDRAMTSASITTTSTLTTSSHGSSCHYRSPWCILFP
jgi:hypothetical protein